MAKKFKHKPKPKRLQENPIKFTYPRGKTDEAIEACKARVANGEKCYCLEECHCRGCQESQRAKGAKLCDIEMLTAEGGCALGCGKCSNRKPCC